ncbi:family S53 protease [Ramaria rubella]|nr:family S53 protease [Ramaria rubella]
MVIGVSFLIASFATLGCTNPIANNLILHEQITIAPLGYTLTGPAVDTTSINLRIALASNDVPGLEKALYDVSTPGNDLYGQHLSKEEVESYVAPTSETLSAVNTWLNSNGVEASNASSAGDWITTSMPVSKANTLFGAEFSVFTHQETGKQTIRTLSYSIPSYLKGHIDLVHPTTTFPSNVRGPTTFVPTKANNLTARATVPASCNDVITPSCLQSIYGIPATKAVNSNNRLGIAGFDDEWAETSDLAIFLKANRPDLLSTTTFTVQTLDGGSNPQKAGDAGIEANLDIQYAIGLASNVPVTFISVGDDITDGVDGLLDNVNFLLAESAPPQVYSTSYADDEDNVSQALTQKLCNGYMALGARGVSMLFASGDGGVSGSAHGGNLDCEAFVPSFPSNCPYVTSVGSTTNVPEIGGFFTTGGFSNYFPTPQYQASAVSSYLSSLGSANSGRFNRTGRGFPDVSLQGLFYEIVVNGVTGTINGTSCSSPAFAAVVALLNDRLITAGKSPLGFLNPFLYSATGKAALNDITTGSNPGCGTNGFPAKAGWDPVSGVGTPNFPLLLEAVGAVVKPKPEL